MSEKENKLEQQGRRPKKAGIGSLPKNQKMYMIFGDKEYEVKKMAKGGKVKKSSRKAKKGSGCEIR